MNPTYAAAGEGALIALSAVGATAGITRAIRRGRRIGRRVSKARFPSLTRLRRREVRDFARFLDQASDGMSDYQIHFMLNVKRRDEGTTR